METMFNKVVTLFLIAQMVPEYKNALKIGIVTMENSKEVPQKIKNRTTI